MIALNRLEKIANIISETKAPPYVLSQIKQAIYKNGVTDYMEISNISKGLRLKLKEELGDVLTLKSIHEVKGDQAHKVLFETRDNEKIEAVRMTYHSENKIREPLCISSQSGCALGCKFCATGTMGFKKNLSADEITDQILFFKKGGHTIDNILFMGMGEPFANPNFFEALQNIINPELLGISQRKLSVSTVGLIPGIKRLTKDFPQVNLAFSLHSPFPKQRLELMPVEKAYPLDEVFDALDEHINETNKKVFIAYVLLKDVNDSKEHAQGIVNLIKARRQTSYLYHVNLIRYHKGPAIKEFEKPEKETVDEFMKIIKDSGVNCTLRQSFGVNIDAACGQLYAKYSSVTS